MQNVTLVELTAFDKITPLASAYLKSYACQDSRITDNFSLRIYDASVTADREAVAADLEREPSEVYALSCYLWNMGLMRWLLARLTQRLPRAKFILGGPQVMNQAADYVAPGQSNIAVCNGEGERTFHQYLLQLLADEPNLTAVQGISFWRGGELITTPAAERIKDLTEIPSPFTGGLFEKGKYTFAVLETNRGCPYNCGFCFWGAATNAKVNRFETERILNDITWISDNQYVTIFLADANWGMAPRDVDFTRHMVECRKHTGYPVMISMNAAKNKPERVAEITKALVDGGLLTSQPISLQSMDSDVLTLIDRSNIQPRTYTELQRTLNEQNISSYVEMIWPLPGETVSTFCRGITDLCRSSASTILVYPHLLLHNTPIYKNRQNLGIRVRRVPDDVAEADVVVATNWVDETQYEDGVWITYAMQSLHNMRGLYYLANYCDRAGLLAFGDLFAKAADFFRDRLDARACQFMEKSVRGLTNYYLLNAGELAHLILHEARDEFDALLADFFSRQPFSDDPVARTMFELDLLARPYVYRESPRLPHYPFEFVAVESRPGGEFALRPAAAAHEALLELGLPDPVADGGLLIAHPGRRKLPYMADRPLEDNISYCQGMLLHLREMLPSWAPLLPYHDVVQR